MDNKQQPHPAPGDRDYYFEQIGDDFDGWMSDYDVFRRVELIRKHMTSHTAGKSCLEIGCGTGRISQVLRRLVGTLTVTDLSEKLARETGQRLNVSWKQQDACSLRLPDESFDVVISSECIEHTPDPAEALREMLRVLKPGGLIVVTSPNKVWYPILWLSMVTGIRKFAGIENWLFPWEAAKVLRDGGVAKAGIDGCHLFPWQIPLAKRVLPFFDRFGKVLYPIMINYCICGIKNESDLVLVKSFHDCSK